MTTNTAVLFGSFSPPLRPWKDLSPKAWTCVGALAIPLWATWPTLALRTLEMPAFECLTIAFLFGWLVLGRAERSEPAATTERTSWRSWVPAAACALGLSGSNAFHILATHYIPAAEANLISYLWPVMIVGLGAVLGFFQLRSRQLVGLVFGFAGAVILMGGGALSLTSYWSPRSFPASAALPRLRPSVSCHWRSAISFGTKASAAEIVSCSP